PTRRSSDLQQVGGADPDRRGRRDSQDQRRQAGQEAHPRGRGRLAGTAGRLHLLALIQVRGSPAPIALLPREGRAPARPSGQRVTSMLTHPGRSAPALRLPTTATFGMLANWLSRRSAVPSLNRLIFIAAAIGILVGWLIGLLPEDAGLRGGVLYASTLTGAVFVGLLKMVLIPLIFTSIVVGVASLQAHHQVH